MAERETSALVTVHPSAGSMLEFGPFRFDRHNQILWRDDDELQLPPRALAILDMLLERAGSVVSKRALLDNVWKETHVTETSLTEAVSLLRQALGDDPQRPTYILTAHRRGYRFVAPVTVCGSPRPAQLVRQVAADAGSSPVPASRPSIPALALWAGVALLGLCALLVWWSRSRPEEPAVAVRVAIETPVGVSLRQYLPALALSPSGDTLVLVGTREDGTSQLFLRRLDSFTVTAIPGSEGARSPFFSPDGTQLGFVAEGRLVRIPLEGGVGVGLCDVAKGFGASWGEDGTIVFSGAGSGGLSRMPAGGGEIEPLTHPQPTAGEIGHWWPQVLPGGETVLYTIWSTTLATAKVAALSLASGESRVLLEGASDARYVSSGHLVYLSTEGILADGFDLSSLQLSGAPFEIRDQAAVQPVFGLVQLAVAGDGTMAYLPPADHGDAHELVLLAEDGTEQALATEPVFFRNMDIDPSGRRLAVTVLDGTRSDVWISALPQPSLSRFTFAGFNIEPRWTPDGQYLGFASNRDGPFAIFRKPVAGGAAEKLIISELHQYPQAWSPDGRVLVYLEAHPETGWDLWLLDLRQPDHPRTPFLCTPHDEIQATLSPDGRWLAYQADDTGRWEVYVRSFPDGNGPWQVSERGGSEPFWSADGTQLSYWDYPRLLSCAVDTSNGFRPSSRQVLLRRQDLTKVCPLPPGRSLLAIREMIPSPKTAEIRVVLGWTAELR